MCSQLKNEALYRLVRCFLRRLVRMASYHTIINLTCNFALKLPSLSLRRQSSRLLFVCLLHLLLFFHSFPLSGVLATEGDI